MPSRIIVLNPFWLRSTGCFNNALDYSRLAALKEGIEPNVIDVWSYPISGVFVFHRGGKKNVSCLFMSWRKSVLLVDFPASW